jgi:hypothetical protein
MNEKLVRENLDIKCILVDDFNNQLEQRIMKAFDELVPLECQVIRRSFYEEPRISKLKCKRKHLLLNAKRWMSPNGFHHSQELAKKIRKVKIESRRNKIQGTILEGGTQGLWKGYRAVEDRARQSIPVTITWEGKIYKENKDKAQAFADFFRGKIDKITEELQINTNVYNGPEEETILDEKFFELH